MRDDKQLESRSYDGTTWIDIVDPTREQIEALGHQYPFHPLNLEDCLSKRQQTRVEEHEDYLFILLNFPIYINQKRCLASRQVSIFIGRNYLVTVHPKEIKFLSEMFRATNESEPHNDALRRSSVDLLYHMIDRLVDELFVLLNKIGIDIEEVEDKVFDERVSAVADVSRIRRQVADMRRIVSPLRGLIVDMNTKVQKFSAGDFSRYFNDVRDHVEKAWETLAEAKETTEIYMDTDYILSTEVTNKILALLTIVFTFSIPATVVGTVYGMNILLPGGIQTGSWTFLGPYTTFMILLTVMIVPVILMAWYFHRLGWI
ncbi:MAG: magnesium transporter CorA family protein [Thaumarchaeota archaeon]|nr:magnesium transporter CorA family protein [Nitrososphaerota archaeon]